MALQSSSSLHPTTNKFHVCLPAMAGVATRVAQLVNLKHPSTLRIRQRHSLQQAFQAHSRRSLSLPPKDARAGVAFALDISFVEAPLVKKELAAEQIYSLVLDISSNPSLMKGHTAAGQYVQLRVPGTDAKPAYISIASPPRTATSGSLEFLIKYVEGSTAGYLCNLKKGDKVEVSPVGGSGFPIDRLYPAEDFPTVLIFATGTGIRFCFTQLTTLHPSLPHLCGEKGKNLSQDKKTSPVRSLIEAGFDAIKRSDVRLYYGTRSLRWMAYQEKFKEWEASGIRVIPVLSQSDGDWEGEAGYVQAAFQKEKGITDPLRTGAILAGQREMMEDVTSHLLAEGVLKEKIIKNF